MKFFQILISALTVFCIVGGGSFGAVLVALEGQTVNQKALLVCLVTGLIAAMKDIRATMALPPLSNGNYEAITQLMQSKNQTQPQPDDKPDKTPDSARPGYTRAPGSN